MGDGEEAVLYPGGGGWIAHMPKVSVLMSTRTLEYSREAPAAQCGLPRPGITHQHAPHHPDERRYYILCLAWLRTAVICFAAKIADVGAAAAAAAGCLLLP